VLWPVIRGDQFRSIGFILAKLAGRGDRSRSDTRPVEALEGPRGASPASRSSSMPSCRRSCRTFWAVAILRGDIKTCANPPCWSGGARAASCQGIIHGKATIDHLSTCPRSATICCDHRTGDRWVRHSAYLRRTLSCCIQDHGVDPPRPLPVPADCRRRAHCGGGVWPKSAEFLDYRGAVRSDPCLTPTCGVNVGETRASRCCNDTIAATARGGRRLVWCQTLPPYPKAHIGCARLYGPVWV